jgi:hypothetical protein
MFAKIKAAGSESQCKVEQIAAENPSRLPSAGVGKSPERATLFTLHSIPKESLNLRWNLQEIFAEAERLTGAAKGSVPSP